MSRNKIIKSVSFNTKNEKDQVILNWIEDMNFSGYVKKLIKEDLELGDQALIHKYENPIWVVSKQKHNENNG